MSVNFAFAVGLYTDVDFGISVKDFHKWAGCSNFAPHSMHCVLRSI